MINLIQHGLACVTKRKEKHFYRNQNEQGQEPWLFSFDLLGICDYKMGEIPACPQRFKSFILGIDFYVECFQMLGQLAAKLTTAGERLGPSQMEANGP